MFNYAETFSGKKEWNIRLVWLFHYTEDYLVLFEITTLSPLAHDSLNELLNFCLFCRTHKGAYCAFSGLLSVFYLIFICCILLQVSLVLYLNIKLQQWSFTLFEDGLTSVVHIWRIIQTHGENRRHVVYVGLEVNHMIIRIRPHFFEFNATGPRP